MIIVKIWGGLGNQLFQYSFGKYLAARLNTAVKYDIQITNKLNSFTQRDLAISFFNVEMEIATVREISKKKYFSNIQLARVERKMAQSLPFLLKTHIVESNEPKPFGSLPFRDNCYYEGYWQSHKYLMPVEALLRRQLTMKQPAREAVLNTLEQIISGPSVSIHVRRGDYLHNKYFTTCKMAYYKEAMAHFITTAPNSKFYVFTDDIAWCKEHFIGPQYYFVTGNEHFEDMYLMSSCGHNIIANSTFSWWAAWLNQHQDKMVVAPRDWHKRHNEKYNDLMPENWIKIE